MKVLDAHIIVWDGSHMPVELQGVPPGRYILEPVDDPLTLTSDEEQGIVAALDELDSGRSVPMREVIDGLSGNRSAE